MPCCNRERMGRYRADEKIAEAPTKRMTGWNTRRTDFAAELPDAGSRDAGAGRRVETEHVVAPGWFSLTVSHPNCSLSREARVLPFEEPGVGDE